jgi:hypothetical protein
MLENSVEIIRSVLKTDPTVSALQRRELLGLLVNGRPAEAPSAATGPSIIRRKEAARRLGRTVRSIDELCSAGILTKVKFANRKRSAGILESSLVGAISG